MKSTHRIRKASAFFLLALMAHWGPCTAEAEPAERPGKGRVVIQPNGWGRTPAAATADLDRVMAIYKDFPGFQRDAYVAVVQVGRNMYQADGRCSYFAPSRPATEPTRPAVRNVSSGAFSSKGGATRSTGR
jgi:hypothetical protein